MFQPKLPSKKHESQNFPYIRLMASDFGAEMFTKSLPPVDANASICLLSSKAICYSVNSQCERGGSKKIRYSIEALRFCAAEKFNQFNNK